MQADLFKVIPQVGNVLSEISKKYGDLSLEELKRRIEDILLKKQTRVVVLMDRPGTASSSKNSQGSPPPLLS